MEKVDILIVGGGPAGLATAAQAASGGSVLVVHRDAEIGLPIRTSGGSWRRSVRALGIPESCYQVIASLDLRGPTLAHTVVFDEDDLPVVLDVTKTYQFLAGRARESGAIIRCGHTFLTGRRTNGGIISKVRGDAGEYDVQSLFVVDATGTSNAVLRQLAGIELPVRFGVGVEYEVTLRRHQPSRAVLFMVPEFTKSGYGWVFPTNRGSTRVGIGVIRPISRDQPGRLLDELLASPLARSLDIEVNQVIETHHGVIPSEGPRRRLIYDRLVAVGDSGGQANPIVGEGIRYCVESGRRLGKALSEAIGAMHLREQILRGYARWWHRQYGRSFILAQQVNRRIASYDAADWDRAIRRVRSFSPSEVATVLRFEIGVPQILGLMARHPSLALKAALDAIRRT